MDLISLFIAILPVVLIGLYIYSKDKEKEPSALLKKLIVGGVLSCLLVLLVSSIVEIFSPLMRKDVNDLEGIELIIYMFIDIALIEEACKMFFLYKYSYNSIEFDYSFDMIVYAVYISLGFAVFENILYVVDSGISTGLLRAVTAVPMHASFGVFMGVFLSNAKQCQLLKKKGVLLNTILAITIPIFLHGLYDYTTMLDSIVYFIVVDILIIIFALLLINKKKKEDKKIQYKYKYCIYCRAPVIGKYCTQCGKENI